MNSILDPVKHERILKDVQGVCLAAGISTKYLHESASTVCKKAEIDWLVGFREYGMPGLKLLGPHALDRCMAIAGALVRNYIDARVRTLDEVLDNPPDCTVLLCPNFYTVGMGKALPSWKIQKLYDLIIARYKKEQPTVIWVESDAGLAEYGKPLVDLLSSFPKSVA